MFGRHDPVALRPDDECGLAEAGESFGGAAQQVLANEDGAEHTDRIAADAALGEDWFQAVAALPRLVSHPSAFGSGRSGRIFGATANGTHRRQRGSRHPPPDRWSYGNLPSWH